MSFGTMASSWRLFLFSALMIFITALNFSDSKSTRANNLKKRRIEISESVCDELSSLVFKLRSSGLRVLESVKIMFEGRGPPAPDFKNLIKQSTGVDYSNDIQVREFVCKVAGAQSLTDITDLLQLPFHLPEELLAREYNQSVQEVASIATELGFDTIKKALDVKEYMMEFALQHNYIQSTYGENEESLGGPRYYGFEVLEEWRKVLTLADMEDVITDMVEKFGNNYPRLIGIAARGCFSSYCQLSDIIVQENRIGCIADAFMFSKNLSDFAARLGISEDQAYREVSDIDIIVNPFPDGAVDFYRAGVELVEFTYYEIPKLYHLTDDDYEYEYWDPDPEEYDDYSWEEEDYYYDDGADVEPEGDDD